MVNRYSSIMLPYFGLISEGYIKEFIKQLEKVMNADGKILTSSITSTYATNRLAADIGLNTDSQTGLLDSVYAAAWNKFKEISPQDTELRYLPPRFNGFYRIDRVFDLLIIVNSDCLYQLLVQNIPTDLISSYCSNGEIDNFYSNSQSIFMIYTLNATYGCSSPTRTPAVALSTLTTAQRPRPQPRLLTRRSSRRNLCVSQWCSPTRSRCAIRLREWATRATRWTS